MDPATHIGAVHLTISNLDRSVAFYESRLGFAVHRREVRTAHRRGWADLLVPGSRLRGVHGRPACILRDPGGIARGPRTRTPAPRRHPYHPAGRVRSRRQRSALSRGSRRQRHRDLPRPPARAVAVRRPARSLGKGAQRPAHGRGSTRPRRHPRGAGWHDPEWTRPVYRDPPRASARLASRRPGAFYKRRAGFVDVQRYGPSVVQTAGISPPSD